MDIAINSTPPVQKATGASVAVAVIGTMIAGFILSWIYGPIEHWSPLVYLNFVITFAAGFAVGKVGQWFLKSKRIDSHGAATLIGLFGGLSMLFFSWLSYIWVITDYNTQTYMYYLVRPWELFEVMSLLAEDPMWTVGKSDMPGILYWITWLAEAVFMVGVAIVTCHKFVDENHLCETCNDWIADTGDVSFFELGENSDALLADLQNGRLDNLPTAKRLRPEELPDTWLEAQGRACPNCEKQDMYVTVSRVVMKPAKKGEDPERDVKVLAKAVMIKPELEDLIFAPLPEAPVEAEPAQTIDSE